MRLVKQPVTKLDAHETSELRDLIDKSIRKDASFFRECMQFRDLLRGRHWEKIPKSKRKMAQITVNLIHSHVRTLVPTLFFQDPYFECVSDSAIYKDSAPNWEGLINLVIRRTDYKEETKKCVMDGILYAEGWKKWVITKDDDSEEIASGEENLVTGAEQAGAPVETGYSGPQAWFAKGQPAGLRTSPTQVIVDYNSPDRGLENARFVTFRYRKLISEIKADTRYTVKKEWKQETGEDTPHPASGGVPGEDRQPITDFWDEDGEETSNSGEYVTLYEMWIYQLVECNLYKQVVVLVDDHDTPILGPVAWSEYTGKHLKSYPITRVVFNEIPDERPVSEVGTWKSLQFTLNWVLSRVTSFVENSKQLYEVDPQKLTNPAKAKTQFYKGGSRELIEVKEPGAIQPIPTHPVQADNYQLINLLTMFITQVGGVGPNQRGSTGARTATEASIIQSNSGIKLGEKEDRVATFMKKDAEILVAMLRSTASADFVFRATGDNGLVKWMQFSQFDVTWSPDVEVRPSSFTKDVDSARLQLYMQAYQMALGLLPVYGPQNVNLGGLVNLILKEMKIPSSAAFLTDQLAQETQQMTEIVEMSMGEDAEVKPMDNHVIHAHVVNAFINSDVGQRLAESNPDAYGKLVEHGQIHMQMMQQIQAQAQVAPTKVSNGFSEDSSSESTPASTANEETASDRESASPYPQGGRAL